MKKFKIIVSVILFTIIALNLFFIIRFPSPETKSKLAMASMSRGDQYFGRLNLWYIYAQQGDWTNASRLESGLDPVDIAVYKKNHLPSELKKTINQLVVKPNKTVEDWIELARIQVILGNINDAKVSITKAKNLDPIRDDISQIYYQLIR